jgi:hypothetical protein
MMKKMILFIPVFLFIINLHAQDKSGLTGFPRSFLGNWKGKMQWIRPGKPTQEFSMQLKIQPTDTAGQFSWLIIYGDDGKDIRPYVLKPVDTAAGHWVIDERDGIILDNYVHGDAIHGAFTLLESTLVDNYFLENGKLHVEFFTFNLGEKTRSGKGTSETPFVDNYRISAYQSGVMTKED